MNSTLVNVVNDMLPLIPFGITVCILSVVVVFYARTNDEYDKKTILKCLAKTFLSATMINVLYCFFDIFFNYKS